MSKYNLYIGKKYTNIYDCINGKYLVFQDKCYLSTPLGLYDEINMNPYLDKLTLFFIELSDYIDVNSDISIGLTNVNDNNTNGILRALQKSGIHKNIILAKKLTKFITISSFDVDFDDSLNSDIAKDFVVVNSPKESLKTIHSYGLYDAEEKAIFEIVPKGTPIEELESYCKRTCGNYKYFVDVEQINNRFNRIILTICEDDRERLYINLDGCMMSGKFRVYFYKHDDNICIDIYDLIRKEWLSTDDLRRDREFKL